MKNQISIKEISKKLKDIFPQVADKYEIISLKSNYSEVKLLSNNKNLKNQNVTIQDFFYMRLTTTLKINLFI